MSEIYNIYCDESCHLENDHLKVMVLGAVWCPKDQRRQVARRLGDLKEAHGLNRAFEVKWTKVSRARQNLYLDIVNFFFDCKDLHFRAVLVPDKDKLCHALYGQSHDLWYYKMYFVMLRQIFCPHDKYNIYLDIKDTRGGRKIQKLHDVLCNSMFDFRREIIQNVQLVRSHEIEQVQLADLLLGAISYLNRGLSSNLAKLAVIERIKELSGYSLEYTTLSKEDKFNLLRWIANEGNDNV